MSKNILVINTEKVNESLYKEVYLQYGKERGYNLQFITHDIVEHDFTWHKKLLFKFSKAYRQHLYDSLSNHLMDIIDDYDVILVLGALEHEGKTIFSSELLNKFKSKNVRMAFSHDMQQLNDCVQYLQVFKKIFSSERSDAELAKNKYGVTVYYPLRSTSYLLFPSGEEKRDIDVCFVGVVTPKRMEYIEAVAKYCKENDKVFWLSGHFWNTSHWWTEYLSKRKFKQRYPYAFEYAKSMYIVPKDLAKIYQRSKICLNINLQEHSSLNTRILDALACKTMVISDYQDTQGEAIKANEHFKMANSSDEMVNLVDYYLRHGVDDENIVNNAFKVVEKFYQPFCRIDKIIFQ